MKMIVGISGASGTALAMKFIAAIPREIELFIIISASSKIVAKEETGEKIESKLDKLIENGRKITIFNANEISANIASGSFDVDMMAVVPTSMDMLAKISSGIADELISRTASVMIKEGKKLLLTPRELPFSAIPLENMLKLSKLGVIIAPPVMAYYAKISDLNSMENFIIGRWLDSLKIPNNLYSRWGS
ncbi:UbiX family flavin prenyltransferase [Helicobacter cappadocius]|uniref:UbiX family flavin prenyltransferase n=1 Tax=Helicobacter cappadocius TaxID=3063998 RepID=A0AA90PLB9_9HELI|nr:MULTISPECIES: UbiX family flavin prenyltransferase [unclassified Helicobacter]MDO7253652.1 UbiX family flavin prenyltransferase [Helicobacter sp. faydin-H75]MDP2539580.1 UbiX family flavin prenyltransferase [Helicobacter sp. faydin-H76]